MTYQNLKIILKKYFYTAVFVLLTLILILNIFFSQYISPLYEGVALGKREAVITYLRKIRLLPEYKSELGNYIEIFGEKIEDDVTAVDRDRKDKIESLEQILTKNNQARDVLYGLYLLYKENGNNSKAGQYLEKAKAIDPNIK